MSPKCTRAEHEEMKADGRRWRAMPLLKYAKRAEDPWKRYEERQCKHCGKSVQRLCPTSDKGPVEVASMLTATQKHVLGMACGVTLKGTKRQADPWAADRLVVFGLLDGRDLSATDKGRLAAAEVGIADQPSGGARAAVARMDQAQADYEQLASYTPSAAGAAGGPPPSDVEASHVAKVLRRLAEHGETTDKAPRRGTAQALGIGRTSVQYACRRISERQAAVVSCLARIVESFRNQAMPAARKVEVIATWQHPGLLEVVLCVFGERAAGRSFSVLADPDRGADLEAGLALELGLALRWLLSDTAMAGHPLGWSAAGSGVAS